MDAHQLTIAKASFAAALLPPDVTKIGRDDLAKFHELLTKTISTCSSANVQTCKQWLLLNIIPSAARISAMARYFITRSKFPVDAEQEKANVRSVGRGSSSRKRIHFIYIVNDVLHHVKYHQSDKSQLSSLTNTLQPFLPELFQSTASDARPRIRACLQDLLTLWESEQYFSGAVVGELEKIAQGSTPSITTEPKPIREVKSIPASTKELQFVMPPVHGDPTAPYYELPAGNMMPHIMPNSSTPIRPERMRTLQFAPGPPDEGLANALKDFLKDIDEMDNPAINLNDDEGAVTDLDELGQISYRDEFGDIKGETYYGWSRAFCEKMKRRYDDDSDQPRPARSRSTSRSFSRSPRKRRRYSDAVSSRSRSFSRSRSRTRNDRKAASSSRDTRNGSSNRRYSRSRSAEPFRASFASTAAQPNPTHIPHSPLPAMLPNLPSRPPFLPPNTTSIPPPFPLPPLGPHGFPIPPPKPPNWSGPWPPIPSMDNGQGLPFPPPPPNFLPDNFFPPHGGGPFGQQPYGRR